MVSIVKPNTYPNSAALTITIASLASTVADPPVGRQGTEIDLTTALAGLTAPYNDILLDGQISTGTTPTTGKIQIWGWGAAFDGTNVRRPAGAGATDAGLTPGTWWKDVWWPLAVINTSATSNVAYNFSNVSFLKNFGGIYLPIRVGVFVFHSTIAALNAASGTHEIRYTPMQTQIA